MTTSHLTVDLSAYALRDVVERVTPERPTRIRMCTHPRGHAWKTVVVPTRVPGIIDPWVKLTCTRCNVAVDADVVRVTEPLLPNRRGRQAEHAHPEKSARVGRRRSES